MVAPCLVAVLLVATVLLLPASRSEGEFGAGQPQVDSDGPSRRRRRRPKIVMAARTAPSTEAVASALALLALAFRSGLPTWQVLDAVADQSADDVSADLRQVAAALRWGADEHEAWASVDPAWAPAARAVSIAHRLAAAQVGVRLVLPLGLVLLPAFCLTTVVPLVVSLGRRLLTSE